MKVAVVGGGTMGEAILGAALERSVFAREQVTVVEVMAARREELGRAHGVATTAEAGLAVGNADLVLLCVKPQDAAAVRAPMRAGALLVSIMAGVRTQTLVEQFAHDRVVRVMPNTPVAVRAGMSVWTATPAVDALQREAVSGLLTSFGRALFVDDEKKLDMATAVSGSGPAYVFLVMEALIEGGVAVGLPRAQAEEMVLQTVYGSALYALESGRSAADLRAAVTSPAGTTAAGLLALERGAVRADFIDCVRAAFERSLELGGAT